MATTHTAEIARHAVGEDTEIFDPPTAVLNAVDVVGEMVRNRQGETLGEIKDLVFDIDRGCVAYAILSFGGFLGLGRRRYPVPWAALSGPADGNGVLLNMPRLRLEKAPAYDQDSRPDLLDEVLGQVIHHYYGVEPYWERS